ncbi:Replication stress response regulator SDE2 like protein [Argiope bruennichi]|uniref:Replication stress response regulator SDE2 like protein n=1 Tax=Argiope bruennichi TaxID=94029 RepID=A0A8T0F856_ARGBR|nr:Replication stress response regulator SDE2 like protein [Argiope bruennichi]
MSAENDEVSADEIIYYISSGWGFNDFKLYYNGKVVEEHDTVPNNSTLEAVFSLQGGKGGFGSMLRAIGAQIEKTTNREACRDLSGRRLRDINEEQRLKKWIAKESEREAEKARRRQARIERLKSKPKHNFVDFEYEKEISQLPERVDEALHAGMEKASKRPKTIEACSAPPTKKKKLWLDEDLSGSSDSDSQEASSSSINATSHTDNAHSSRSEASGSESSNDSLLSEPKCDAVIEKDVPMAVCTEEKVNATEENQISSNVDAKSDQTIQEIEASQASSSSSLTKQEISNAEASCSSTINVDEKAIDSTGEVKSTIDSQLAGETQIEDVDLMSYESASELEQLGLDRLKVALMTRGLKCGGTIFDRAQRLWKVRGLQPHEYPPNLLAKNKK